MRRAEQLYEKIKKRLEEIAETHPDLVIWNKKPSGVDDVGEDSDFMKGLVERGFVNYIGADLASQEVVIGELVGKARRYESGAVNLSHGLSISHFESRHLRMWLEQDRNPLRVLTYAGEEALVVGLKHDVFSPLLDYADSNIEWEYRPESNCYCDGSKASRENDKRIIKCLEYILANLNLIE